MLKKLALAASATALASGIGLALAGSTPANLTVSASVAANCSISSSAVAFGAYDPTSTHSSTGSDLNVNGSVSVTCTKNSTGVTITLGSGLNPSGALRQMAGLVPGNLLQYQLHHPSATTPAAVCTYPGSQIWGTAGADIFIPSGIANWGANATKVFNVCGTIPKAQDAAADTYSDTVVATVNF
jgi:spore coat protein U-like protein